MADKTPTTSAKPNAEPKAAERLWPARPPLPEHATAKGFDPYNSGAFDKRKTWERVLRK